MSDNEYLPFTTIDPLPPYNEVWEWRRRLATQLRALNENLVTHDLGLAELQQLSAKLALLVQESEQAPVVHGRLAWAATADDHGGYHLLSREVTPLAGQANALAPPLHLWLDHDAGEAHARLTLGWAFEGPPACVHGGVIAALFDEFLGCAQVLTGQSGATGTLSVRYHKPTPLGTELTLLGRIKEVRGRKIIVEGTLSANGEMTASCEGLFVSFAEGVMKLAERNK